MHHIHPPNVPPIHPPICPSIFPCIYPANPRTHPFICQPISKFIPSFQPTILQPIQPSFNLFFHVSHLANHPSISQSIYLCIPSIQLTTHPPIRQIHFSMHLTIKPAFHLSIHLHKYLLFCFLSREQGLCYRYRGWCHHGFD